MVSDPVQDRIRQCTRCALHKVYSGPVPINLTQPGWLCIGEAPGAEEDENGTPFSGPSGRFLRMRLREAGVQPSRTSFCNVISCRPHANRTPSTYELQRCRGNLLAQINVAQPRVVILLGKTALTTIYPYGVLKQDIGRVLYWGKIDGHNVWMVPTWHPAYIIRPDGRQHEKKWKKHLEYAASLIRGNPTFPTTCKVCGADVGAYDVMAGAWCKYHYKEVPRQVWQDEMPGMGETFDPDHSTGKSVKRQKARARKMGLI